MFLRMGRLGICWICSLVHADSSERRRRPARQSGAADAGSVQVSRLPREAAPPPDSSFCSCDYVQPTALVSFRNDSVSVTMSVAMNLRILIPQNVRGLRWPLTAGNRRGDRRAPAHRAGRVGAGKGSRLIVITVGSHIVRLVVFVDQRVRRCMPVSEIRLGVARESGLAADAMQTVLPGSGIRTS